MKTSISIDHSLLGSAATIVVVALSGCIAPQDAQCQCPTNGSAPASASNASADTAGAAATQASTKGSNVPAAVKPTGTLLSDGASDKLQGVDPPGSWFVFNDRTAKGVMTPASTGEFGSTAIVHGAVHTQGKGFSDWGGGIGFNFVGADSVTPLDASVYSGITFKAWGSTPMHVALATVATMPDFGECTKCYDHFATDVTDLTSTPKTYTFKWSQLRAAGWGAPKASLDTHTLIGLNFTSKGAVAWDFSVKDIAFTQ
jgi:hypothetical protein